jgi:hypothetical protein
MPPDSSHLLQPLDVGCFRPLKQVYGRQVEDLMRAHINHVSLQFGGLLTAQDANDLLEQKVGSGEPGQEMQSDGGGSRGTRRKVRCCGVCGKPCHNARTCQEGAESSDSAVSDVIIVGSQCCCVVIGDSVRMVVESVPLAYLFRSLIIYVRYQYYYLL